MRNALAYVPKTQQSMVAAALRQAFLQPDRAQASQKLRHVADQLRPKWPKLAAFIDDSETEVLSYLDFPEQYRSKLHSTNPLERLNKEVRRRADVVGISLGSGADAAGVQVVLEASNGLVPTNRAGVAAQAQQTQQAFRPDANMRIGSIELRAVPVPEPIPRGR